MITERPLISEPPLIAVTPWRRTLSTWVHPQTDLYTIDPEYFDSVRAAGGIPALVPWVSSREEARSVLARFDGLLVSGGQDVDPMMYNAVNTDSVDVQSDGDVSDIAMIGAAGDLGLPALCICRGLQVLNVAFGGTLLQHTWDYSEHHPARPEAAAGSPEEAKVASAFLANRHPVDLTAGSTLAKRFDAESITVNSLHHQSIDELGDGLVVAGRAPDGIIEAIEHDTRSFVGVQWHPERLVDDGHLPLFSWLVDTATTKR